MEQAMKQQNPKIGHYEAVADAYRSTKKTIAQEYFVIDCDRHIIEPPHAFTKFLDKEFNSVAPKITSDNTGASRLMVEGRLYQKPTGSGVGRTEGIGDQRPRGKSLTYQQAHEHVFRYRDEDLDIAGIDVALWIPTLGLFIPDIVDRNLQYGVARALNDWTAKEWATGKRHLWCASIPIVPSMAVEEIKRCKKLGATSICMRPNVMQGVHWWDESWDTVWETMTNLGMPLVMHEGTGTYNATYSTDYKYDKYWLAHVVSHPCEMTTGLCSIIGYGVLHRHPKLKVLFCEAGATWVPYFLYRLDSHFEGRGNEMVDIDMLPSEYFYRQCAICSFEPEEALMKETMAWFKGKNICCTSDYPHWDSSGVSGVKRYLANYPDFDEETRHDFFYRNATDALGLQP